MEPTDAPFRVPQRTVTPCDICGVDASSGCPLCGKPLCLQHLDPTPPHLCVECGAEQNRRRGRINKWSGGIGLSAGGALAVSLGLLNPVMAPLGLFAGLTVFGVCAGLAHRMLRRRNQRRMQQRTGLDGLQRVAIAPRSSEGSAAASRRQLSPRRGGHDPPARPPGDRIGYNG